MGPERTLSEPLPMDQIAYEYAPIGIVLTEHRVIKSCNKTFADLFGYDKSELLGQSFRMLYATHQEFENIRDIGLGSLRERGIYSDERMVTRKDGTQIWCRFRAQTLTRDAPLNRTVLSFALISDQPSTLSLSLRERQVVTHLSKGLTSKEIARVLDKSPRTIEDVRSRLLKKFKMKNATELLAHLTHIDN